MGKGTSSKLDTIVNIEINRNPCDVVLQEPLLNVEWLELQYIRLSDLPSANFPPKYLYLELGGLRNGPRLTTNVIRDGTWNSTTHPPPSNHNFPLHFEVSTQGLNNVAVVDWPYRVIHGYQHGINFLVEEFGRLSDFNVKICGADHLPIPFEAETVAQLVFRAHYQGKRNLDQGEQVRLYSRLHN